MFKFQSKNKLNKIIVLYIYATKPRDVTAEGKGVVESNNPKAVEEFEAFMKELLA